MSQSFYSAWKDRCGFCFGGGGSGGGSSSNTVTQSVQIPQFEQDFAYNNQNMANSLSNNPYPQYGGALTQGFTQPQNQGMQMAQNAAGAYGTDLNNAQNYTAQGALGGFNQIQNAMGETAGVNNGAATIQAALRNAPANANVMASYMSPYVQQSLQPQVTALQTQLGQQQNQINAQATQAGAFGDARQGTEQALQNFYGNQALSGLEAQGYNTAYGNALQTALGEQQLTSQAGQALGSLGLNEQQTRGQLGQMYGNLGLQAGQQEANLGGLQQSLGINGANAVYNVGTQQQNLGQQELNQAYQQYLNQVNWPFQMLNVRESALSNSPYNMVNATTVPQANMTAQGFGAGVGALGSLASLLGGGGGSNAPFGGTSFPSPH